MTEIDDIQEFAHEIKSVQSVLNAQLDAYSKHGEKLRRVTKRVEDLKKRVDEACNHHNSCFKKDCPNRQKFPPRDPHASASGAWM